MSQTFFDRLGDELDAAAARRASRRSLAPRAAIAAAVAAVAGVAGFALLPSSASAGVDVEVRDGLVHLRLLDLEHDADEIEAAAAEAGLDVEVEAVPVGPSLVGRFLDAQYGGERPGELRPLDEDGDTFAGFVLPQGWEGTLDLLVGRPAEDGEGYRRFTNAVSDGEPLACTGILGMAPGEARRVLDHGLRVEWQVDGPVAQVVPADDLADWEGHRVGAALSTAPDAVVLVLTPDGEPPRAQQPLTRPAADC